MNLARKGKWIAGQALENSTVEGRKDGDELCVVVCAVLFKDVGIYCSEVTM